MNSVPLLISTLGREKIVSSPQAIFVAGGSSVELTADYSPGITNILGPLIFDTGEGRRFVTPFIAFFE